MRLLQKSNENNLVCIEKLTAITIKKKYNMVNRSLLGPMTLSLSLEYLKLPYQEKNF